MVFRGIVGMCLLLTLVACTNVTENVENGDMAKVGIKTGASFALDLTPGSKRSQAMLDAEFEEMDTYTAQFSIIRAPTVSGDVTMLVLADATLTWKVQGNQISRRVTIGQGKGISIQGNAEALSVFLRDESLNVPAGAPIFTTVCNVSRGPRGVDTFPPIWTPDQFLNGPIAVAAGSLLSTSLGLTNGVPIPPDVGVKSMFVNFVTNTPGTAIPAGSIAVRQEVLSNAGFKVLLQSDPVLETEIPIVPGANGFDIFLAAGAPANLIVTVQFGVDG